MGTQNSSTSIEPDNGMNKKRYGWDGNEKEEN